MTRTFNLFYMNTSIKYYIVPKDVNLESLKTESDKKFLIRDMSAITTLLYNGSWKNYMYKEHDLEEDQQGLNNHYVEIPSHVFEKQVNSRYYVGLTKLIESNVINSSDSYKVGEYAISYTFSDINYWTNFDLIANPKYQEPIFDLNDIYGFLSSLFNPDDLTVDIEAANQAISKERDLRKRGYRQLSIMKFAVGDYYLKKDKYGRFYSNFTNIPSNYRKFLTYKNESLKGIDLPNAQPLLLLIILKTLQKERTFRLINDACDILNDIDESGESVDFLEELVVTGKFYGFIVDRLIDLQLNNFENEDRNKFIKKVKIEVLKWINAKKRLSDDFRPYIDKIIEENFKPLHTLIWAIKSVKNTPEPMISPSGKKSKKKPHANAAKVLQTMESEIIIQGICVGIRRIVPEIKLFTIHDCIYTTESNYTTLCDYADNYMKVNHDVQVNFHKD